MSSCCPVCYRATEENHVGGMRDSEKFGENEKLQKRFFELFERYLNQESSDVKVLGRNQPGARFLPNALAGAGMVSCGQCLELMESFCELFHQLKTTELLIAWKVGTLKEIMKCAGEVPSRVNNLRDFIRRVEAPKFFDDVVKSRNLLIENCSQKLTNAIPRHSIEKWRSDEDTLSTGHFQPEPDHISSTGNEISNAVNEDFPSSSSDEQDDNLELETNKNGSKQVPPHVDVNPANTFNFKCKDCSILLPDAKAAKIVCCFCQSTSEVSCQKSLYTFAPAKEAVVTDISSLRNLSDNIFRNNCPSRTLIVDENQIGTQEDDDHGDVDLQMDDNITDVYSGALLAPSQGKAPLSNLPVSAQPPIAEMESVDRIERNMKRNMQLPRTSCDAAQNEVKTSRKLTLDTVSCDTNVLSDETPTEQVSRLRSTHRCQDCGRTFSSNERLKLHRTEFHIDDDVERVEQADNEGVSSDIDPFDGNEANECLSDSDDMSWLASSSDEQQDNFHSETETIEECSRSYHSLVGAEIDMKPSLQIKREGHLPVPALPYPGFHAGTQFRFKCPDCSILFAEINDLLLHRKTSKPCGDSNDISTCIKVEVLALTVAAGDEASIIDSNFVDIFAIVDLPQEIHICGSCNLAVYSLEDIEAHKKLHGSFQCNFCDVTKSCAPDIALHEYQEHFKKIKLDTKQKQSSFNCIRCSFVCASRNYYIRHHLSRHLSLTLIEPRCPICKTNSASMAAFQPGNGTCKFQIEPHLKMYHDLSNITNRTDELKRCEAENCPAYFLTEYQLAQHESLRHGHGRRKRFVKGSTGFVKFRSGKEQHYRLKCLDCNNLFCSTKEILTHRRTSDCFPGPYDPSASVKVQVLVISTDGGHRTTMPIDQSEFVKVCAVADLPQEIHTCENCDMVVYSSEDMEVHKTLHGTFKCNFCNLTKPYAPDLAIHESMAHQTPETRASRKRSHNISCVRCDFQCKYRNDYIRHHLCDHLSLTYNDPNCAICKTNSESMIILHSGKKSFLKFQIGAHLTSHHDLSNVIDSDDLKKCEEDNCKAYFLTTEQLAEHKQLRHISQDKSVKRCKGMVRSRPVIHPYYRLRCPDCSGLFYSAEELLIHRKDSDSCSSSYNPSASLKVEVLVPPTLGSGSDVKDDDESLFTTIHAIIDIPQAIFPCDSEGCGNGQYSFEEMEAHKLLHGSFPCNFCKAELSTAPKLAIHERRHSKKEKRTSDSKSIFVCPRCNFKCVSRTAYVRHHVSTHLSLTLNEPVCPICKSHNLDLTGNPGRHATHFKNMHDVSDVIPEDIRRCTVPSCDAYFLTTPQLKDHLWLRHQIGEVRDRRSRLHQPKDTASDNIFKESVKCDKIMETPKRPKTHKCRDCGKAYTLLRSLLAHRIKRHVDPDKVIRCTVPKCSREFESKKQLEFHMKHCLLYHKSLDGPTKEKVYVQCPKCGKSVNGKNPSYLAAHIMSHERSHICELCGKVFKLKPLLDQHLLHHSGPEGWKFECSVCSKRCMSKQKLDEHMRTHTKEKPYVCQICGLKYAGRHNLRFHVNNKHGDVMEDKARKMDKTNLMSRKGIKRKKAEEKARETATDDNESEDDGT